MNNVKIFNTQSNYFLKQKSDIAKYGKKANVKRFGVPFAIVQEITPYRRLSNKPIKFSDSKYFIERYEKQNPQISSYVEDWDTLSNEEKVNYIVKERYSELIIHKIMNLKLKGLFQEFEYALNMDGEIISLDIGKKESVTPKNYRRWFYNAIDNELLDEKMLTSRTVHNHPSILSGYPEYIAKQYPSDIDKVGSPFSDLDIANCYRTGHISYVIDSYNHRYKYTPFRKYCGVISPNVKKIKTFISKSKKFLFSQKTGMEDELTKLWSLKQSGVNINSLQNKIFELFHKINIHSFRNLQAKTDYFYALSDFGKYEQLK